MEYGARTYMAKKISLRFIKNLPDHEKRLTISTVLTISRIISAPIVVAAMVAQYWGAAFALIVIAALTDILDGMVARWRNEQTFLGACLDPVADKLFIVSVFSTLSLVSTPLFSLPTSFVLFVLIKELVVIIGALYLFTVKGHLSLEVTILGKMAMAAQTIFIQWLFSCYFFGWFPIKTYYWMLALVTVLVAGSFIDYSLIAYRQLRNG